MPLERGEHEEPLLKRNGSGRSSQGSESPRADPSEAAPACSRAPTQLRSFRQFKQSSLPTWWHWPAALVLSALLVVVTKEVMRSDRGALAQRREAQLAAKLAAEVAAGRQLALPLPTGAQQQVEQAGEERAFAPAYKQQMEQQAVVSQAGATPSAVLQQQLAGCRTSPTDPVPTVDTEASLAALDGLTEQQRQAADTYAAAVAACTDFACLRRANELPRAPGQFHFPHFMVIGFPKCATTSIYCHLIQHPQVQHPQLKEPHTLMDKCSRPGVECPADTEREYLVDVLNLPEAARYRFTKAAFEGSTHFVLEADWMAAQLAATFPWLRVVVALRDPISQAITMYNHNVQHNRSFGHCGNSDLFNCIMKNKSRYTPKLAQWLDAFPDGRLHLMQYESLTSPDSMGGVLASLKSFLGIDTALPSSQLPLTNYKHQCGAPDALGRYWTMQRGEYEFLVRLAQDDTAQFVDLLRRRGYADSAALQQWAANWEAVWVANLEGCEGKERASPCKIIVS